MTRGRKRLSEREAIRWHINVPADIHERVTKVLGPEIGNLPGHGARSSLVASLLLEWLLQREPKLDKPQQT